MATNFCPQCGAHLEPDSLNCPQCGYDASLPTVTIDAATTASPVSNIESPKSAVLTLILAIFFGMFGFHRFYVKKLGTGLLMLLTLGGIGIWGLVDLIGIINNKFEDNKGRTLILFKRPTQSKKALMTVGAIIVSFIVSFAYAFVLILYATSGLIAPIHEQLNALQAGDIQKAYSYTSIDFQNATSLDGFKAFINEYPSLKNNSSSFFNEREIQNNTGIVKGTLTAKDGAKTPIEYKLIREGNAWKIMSIQVNPVGAGIKVNP